MWFAITYPPIGYYGWAYFAFFSLIFLYGNSFFRVYYTQHFARSCNILSCIASYLMVTSYTLTFMPKLYTKAIAGLIVNLTVNWPIVLIILLQYIDLFQSKWQHETIIWEGLPCSLFCIAVFYFKHDYFSWLSAIFPNLLLLCQHFALCFCLPIFSI